MALPNRTGRSRFTLALLIVSSITLLTLDFRGFAPLDATTDALTNVIRPVRDGAETVFSPVTTGWNAVFGEDDLESEVEQLRAENAALRADLIENRNAAAELEKLATELGLDVVGDLATTTARVISGPVGNFDEYQIVIDKGADDGLAPSMPVIASGGLVGRVTDVGEQTSRIALLNEPGFSVGVKLVDADDIAVARGTGRRNPLEVSEGIGPDTEVGVGDAVVTSGIERSLYPGGIPVGTVVDVRFDDGALEQTLFVEPAADLDDLSFVTVILFTGGES